MRGTSRSSRTTSILGLLTAGPGLFLLLTLALAAAPSLRAETLRLLALRVDFAPDTLATTSGDGTFESAFPFAGSWWIDPLPHDSLYFDHQLAALENYYDLASSGSLALDWEIWPRGAQAAYRLPRPMWHYHWNQEDATTDEQLAELFADAFAAADADPQLAFLDGAGQPRVDAYIIFHAGMGQDFGPDATPHDIPSAFLTAQDVTVHEAAGDLTIHQGLLLPESENHEDFQHGLTGLLALQFGHQLGLPNLYESTTGRSVIGKWGLMDQGSANFNGLSPAPLDPWSRLLMGWDAAETVAQAHDSVQVAAPAGPAGLPRILRIPLTENEYLLVENRVGDADVGLAGDGMLIWHVDERAATPEAIAANTVNDDPRRRGVDLEEGDGVQDIGRDYGLFSLRGPVALGGDEDPWQKPNTGWYLVNSHYGANVTFAHDTEPSTASNDGLYTGLRLDHFSAPGPVGSFRLGWDGRPAVHHAALAPALDSTGAAGARVQGFSWPADGDTLAWLSLVDGRGRSYGLPLAGDLLGWPRGDGFLSPLPGGWQDELRGIWQTEENGAPRLLAQRGDSLALFAPVGDPPRFQLSHVIELDSLRAVLATGGGPAQAGDNWAGRTPGLFAVAGTHLLRLDPPSLDVIQTLGVVTAGEVVLVETADGSGLPGVLSSRLSLAGQPVLYAVITQGAELMAWDAEPEDAIESLLSGPALATAVLRNPFGAYLYYGYALLGRIFCANHSVRPIQFGPDPGLELAFQLPEGGWRIYSQAGTRLADLPLDDGHAAPLTGSRSDAGGLSLLASAPDRLSGLDADGGTPATWPRVMPPLVAEPLALPELGWVLGVGLDGRVEAWEAELDGPVWTQPGGNANGGRRPVSSGAAYTQPVRQVRENRAFVWPNPAADQAHLRFWLDGAARVTLTAYDTAGDRVARLERVFDRAGEQEILWSLGDVAPGAYFCLLEAEGAQDHWTRRVKCAVLR